MRTTLKKERNDRAAQPGVIPSARGLSTVFGVLGTLLMLVGLSATQSLAAEEESERIDDLEEKVDILTEEVGRLESIFAVPEELELVSVNGLGPAASKVYKKDRGLSIGGYGEVRLRHFEGQDDDSEDDILDALRAVFYVGYKFNDHWVVNSEIELEHAGTGGGGSVSTEFLTVDYLHQDEINARAGLLLIPMGFVNEIHEPTFFYGAERPEIERRILPSTWRENGAGIYGRIADRIEYRMYVVNGFEGTDFTPSGLRGGRQKGSEALANDFAFVGRVDVDVAPGLLLGGSVYTGQTGQEQGYTLAEGTPNESSGTVPDQPITIVELHAQYKGYGASLRALWTHAYLSDAGEMSRNLDLGVTRDPTTGAITSTGPNRSSIGSEMQGYYVEAGYDVLPLILPETRASLEPYFRFESYNTHHKVAGGFSKDRSQDVQLYTAGLQFKPIPNVVFKVDYRRFHLRKGSAPDQVQALVGYVF